MLVDNSLVLGSERQNAHPNGTPRYYNDPNKEDIIGIAGEIAFGNRYNLKIDDSIRPNGDNHIDFKIEHNGRIITFDVKTANKAYNLLIKEWEINVCADVLVLAEYNEGNIKFLGWESKREMAKQPVKVFSSLGIRNYYKHRDLLNNMSRLDTFFTNNIINQLPN